jgi:hypothetical protein
MSRQSDGMHTNEKAKLSMHTQFPRYLLLQLSEGLNDWQGWQNLKLCSCQICTWPPGWGCGAGTQQYEKPSKWKFGKILQAAVSGCSQTGKLRWCKQQWLEGEAFSKKLWRDFLPRDWGGSLQTWSHYSPHGPLGTENQGLCPVSSSRKKNNLKHSWFS